MRATALRAARDGVRIGCVLWLLLMVQPHCLFAGTTGYITGRVVDKAGNPVPLAAVVLVGQGLGAYTDDEGVFDILNIPPGTYEVKVSYVGEDRVLEAKVVTGVVVSADNTTRLEVELGESAFAAEEVVVTAESLPVDIGRTSSRALITTEQIEQLPVQELEDVVNLQAGVVDGHFRGGRLGEVQFQVDGVSVNNAYDNESTLRLDRSLLQEVQVISGTFDAEYGQAMSGVVNAVLKQGSPRWSWSGEMFGGGFIFPDGDDRLISDQVRPGSVQNYQATVSGPTGLPSTVFLLSGRRYGFDEFVSATRAFVPTDQSDFENKVFVGTGDGEEMPLGYSHEWSGAAKVTNTSIENVKLNYQAIFNFIEARRNDYAFRLNPDGLSTQETTSIAHGFDWNQSFGKSYLDVSLRQNYYNYEDMVYDDVFDPRYDAAGPPRGDAGFEDGAYVQGVEFTRFRQKTDAYLAKTNFVNQLSSGNLLKFGGEFQYPLVEFGTPGHLAYTTVDGVERLVRHIDDPPDFPAVRQYRPIIWSTYVQDQIDWSELSLRAGVRFDYFDARSYIPSDPANPANAIQGVPVSAPQPTTIKTSFAPRLGIAYPINERAAIHFAYGHFYQFPSLNDIFSNADYQVLENLQAGGIDYGVMGNPDVDAEKTVQYEIGYKHAFSTDLGADVTVFFKDIRRLVGVEFISTYNNAEYARLTNVDFGDVLGITVMLDHRRFGPTSVALDYTWQQALGNSSDPRETATRAEAGQDPRPRLVPFDWDQRHTLNMTVALGTPGNYTVSAVLRVGSGQPYTPVIEAGFGSGLVTNSGRKPVGTVLDVRGEKSLGRWSEVGVSLFARAFNLFDARYFNGSVFPSTGSPYYSRFPEADRVTLNDPTRFYPPRRIEVGVRFGSEVR